MSWRRDFTHDGEQRRVTLRHVAGSRYVVQVGDTVHEVEANVLPDGRIRCDLDGHVFEADSAPSGRALQVRVAGRTWTLQPSEGRAAQGAIEQSGVIEAPMTGTVIQVAVEPGATVEVGQTVVVLSAMKIEHKLVAGIAGTVAELNASIDDTVDQGAILARIEPAEDADSTDG